MIQENFLHIKERDTFESLKEDIRDDSLTFIKETGTLFHKNKEFLQPRWKEIGEPKKPDPFNGYDYVDMGEAGIWATCNIGAEKPEDYGLYFAWGETEGYENASSGKAFNLSDYKYGSSETNFFKYVNSSKYGTVDNLTILEPEDDAAHVNMGGDWRMPTTDEFIKLNNLCNSEWTDDYEGTGVPGRIFKLKIDKSKQLFFPAAG